MNHGISPSCVTCCPSNAILNHREHSQVLASDTNTKVSHFYFFDIIYSVHKTQIERKLQIKLPLTSATTGYSSVQLPLRALASYLLAALLEWASAIQAFVIQPWGKTPYARCR